MPLLRTTLHPGVMPADTKMRVRYQRGPHLMAGSLDGACGVYALWSALIALGVATRAQVLCLRYRFTDDQFEEAWVRGLDTFFLGSDDDELVALLQTVDRCVCHRLCKGPMRSQVAFVTNSLRSEEVVLLGLEHAGTPGGHWVLAVGLEELATDGQSKLIGILCLDSSEPAPQLLRFNARLELDSPHFGASRVRYRKANGDAHAMKIITAIALKRRPLPTRSSRKKEAGQ